MSREPKYKLGDQVEYTYTSMTRYGVGTVVETQSTDTHTSYWVQFGLGREWLAEHEICRAASSPDEQDIDNAGGSDPRPTIAERRAEARAAWNALHDTDNSEPKRREKTLTKALELINGDRATTYDTKGDAAGNFERIAALWSPVLGVEVTPVQVALCLAQLKVARIITSNGHEDSWVDLAGYAALGSEIAGGAK